MKKGQDYIVFALDFDSIVEAEKYVKMLDGKVGMFKIGLELFIQAGPEIIRRVKDLSGAGIFLDLKFHDISETVRRVMERVAAFGVDLVTVHCSASQKMVEMAVVGGKRGVKLETGSTNISGCRSSDGSRDKGKNKDKDKIDNRSDDSAGTGVLGVTVLTDHDASVIEAAGFRDNFVNDISALVMKRARMAFDAGCRGVVCSGHEASLIKSGFGPDFMAVTPGIRPVWSLTPGDDQKRVTTPAMAVSAGADLIVIGRPLRSAADPAEAALRVAAEIEEALNL